MATRASGHVSRASATINSSARTASGSYASYSRNRTCRHRGVKLCRSDRGNASHFRCPYHGWTYSNSGELVGVTNVAEARETWPDARLAMHHRIGRIDIGEASIIIAAASAHRGDAFAACRYTIERVKQIVPIWKHEHFEGGDVWLEGATADPDDETARQTAYRIACA